jgi:hypothetical protein
VGGRVLPCEIKNRALHAWYWSVVEATSGSRGSGVLDGEEVVVVRLGGVDGEIEQGVGFFTPNGRY